MPSLPPLAGNQCQVWWARPGDAREAHLALLDPVERERRAAFHRQVDRDRFTVGAALLRLVVAGHAGADPAALAVDRSCAHCGRPHGKPDAPGTGLAVSVSHAGDRVAVACGRFPHVGVDVEERSDAAAEELAGRVLAPGESAGTGGFFTYWTRKEAVLKATGDGLRVPMTEVVVSAPDEPPAVLGFAPRPELVGRFAMATLHPGEGYAAALAVLRADGPALPAGRVTERWVTEQWVTERWVTEHWVTEQWVTEHDGSALLLGGA